MFPSQPSELNHDEDATKPGAVPQQTAQQGGMKLVSGDAAARKPYLSAIIDSIVVSENTIRITGSNDNLRSALGPNGQPTPVVRKSAQEVVPLADSRLVS